MRDALYFLLRGHIPWLERRWCPGCRAWDVAAWWYWRGREQ